MARVPASRWGSPCGCGEMARAGRALHYLVMPEVPRQRRRIGGAVAVGAGIFLSRIAGLVRERAIAHYLGLSAAVDAFRAALRIPNMLQNLLGEGVLSASFIPVYARLLAHDDEETAGRVGGIVASLLALAMAV